MIFQFYDSEMKNQIGLKYFTAKDIITNYKAILSKPIQAIRTYRIIFGYNLQQVQKLNKENAR